MSDIYKQHSVNRPYTEQNYKQVLGQLEDQGKITASKHRRNTFGDNVVVTFPDQERNGHE